VTPVPGVRRPERGVLVGLALVAGVALRFIAVSPMWLDEALSANIAELPVSDLLDALRSDGHPPLYYLLLHVWGELVGTSDVALRALSGVLSVAALPLVWIAGRRFGGPVAGWVAVAVLAMNPFALRYATENRMYSLVAVEVLVVWLVADDLWAGRRARWRVPLLAVAAGALLLTQYWGAFLLLAIGVVAMWRWWRGTVIERSGSRWVVAGLAGGGLLFVPWLPSFLEQLGSTGTPWSAGMRPTAALGLFLGDLAGGEVMESVLFVALFGVLLVLGLFGRTSTDPRLVELDVRTTPTVRLEMVVVALTLVAGVGVGWLSDTAFASRYAMVVLPLLVLVLAAGVLVVTDRAAQSVLLVLVLAAGVVGTAHELTYPRTQADEWAAAVAEVARPGDVVAACPDQLGPATERALRHELGDDLGGLEVVGVPALDGARFVDWVDYAERNASADPVEVAGALSALAGPDGSVFVVWNPVYRTYERLCDELLGALRVSFPEVTDLVAAKTEDTFEHGTLTWFRR